MDVIDKAIRYNTLLSLYAPLLSDTQKEILEDYYSFNLSISEIADNRKVSRAAVEDAIKKGTKKLDSIEEDIGNLKVLKKIEELREKTADEEIISSLEEMERTMKHGI